MATKEENQQSKNRQEMIELEIKFIELKHKYKMEELEYERETQKRFHENQMSYHRIKRADINRELDRKQIFNDNR